MDAGAYGWLVNAVSKHLWRVAAWYEYDDLIQDGIMLWWHIINTYETQCGRVRSRKHLMSLFKTSFSNHVNRMANNASVARVEVFASDIEVPFDEPLSDQDEWDALGVTHDVTELERFVAEVPRSIAYILIKLMQSDGWPSLTRVWADGTRETFNDRLCSVVGVDPQRVDITTPLRAYLERK
jgi:hypothetical protein